MNLPPGFIHLREGSRTCIVRADLEQQLRELGFVSGDPTRSPVSTLQGRVVHAVFSLPGDEVQVIWKHCRRGGLIEPILGDRHLGVGRFLRELEITQRALYAGVSVAETYGISVESTPTGWKRVEMISRVVKDAQDLEAALEHRLAPDLWRKILEQSAQELRRFHGNGFLHGDLNLKNILWCEAPDAIRVTLIDLDPGAVNGRHTPQRNLLRLLRSYLKGAARERWRLSTNDLLRFASSYYRGDRAALVSLWRAGLRLLARERLRRPGLRTANTKESP